MMRFFAGVAIALALPLAACAQTQNIKDLRLIDGVSTGPRFRHNGDGVLRSNTTTGTQTGTWNAQTGDVMTSGQILALGDIYAGGDLETTGGKVVFNLAGTGLSDLPNIGVTTSGVTFPDAKMQLSSNRVVVSGQASHSMFEADPLIPPGTGYGLPALLSVQPTDSSTPIQKWKDYLGNDMALLDNNGSLYLDGNLLSYGTITGSLSPTDIKRDLGTAGQVLATNSGADGTEWVDQSGGGGGGTTPTLQQVTDQGNTTTESITADDITATGDIVASGDISATSFTGPGFGLTALDAGNITNGLGTSGQVLATKSDLSGTEWKTVSGGGSTTLAGLTDVDLSTSPTDTQVLAYSSAASKWKASSAGTGDATLAGTQTFTGDKTFSGAAIFSGSPKVRPASSGGAFLYMMPNSSPNNGEFALFGTDFQADATNYNYLSLTKDNSSFFKILSRGHGSTAALPMVLSANNSITQLVLNTNGSINMGGALTLGGALGATNGGSLGGTYTGNPTLSGNPTFSGSPTFSSPIGIGVAPTSRLITLKGATPEMTCINTASSNKQWHWGGNGTTFDFVETGVAVRFVLDGAGSAFNSRAAFGTATPPTSGAYCQTPSLSIYASTDAGTATILSGNSSITVSSTAAAVTDAIPVTYKASSNSGGALWVESITAGTSFVIHSTAAVSADTIVNWRIIH